MMIGNNRELALIKYINSELGKPFKWGVLDCWTFTRGCIVAVWGENDLPKPEYSTEEEARIIGDNFNYIEEFGKVFDIELVERNFIQPGDIILIEKDDFTCCHVSLGSNWVSVFQDKGVRVVPARAYGDEQLTVIRILKRKGI